MTLFDAIVSLAPALAVGGGALWRERSTLGRVAAELAQARAAAIAHAEPLRLRRESRIVVLRGPAEGGESPMTAYLLAVDGWSLVVTHQLDLTGQLSTAALADLSACDAAVLDRCDPAQFAALAGPLAAVDVVVGLTPPRTFYENLAAWGDRFTGASTRAQAAFWLLAGLQGREQRRIARLILPVPTLTPATPAPAPVTPGALSTTPAPVVDAGAYRRLEASFAPVPSLGMTPSRLVTPF